MSASEVDAILSDWRQGDALVGAALPFVTLAHEDLPLTEAAQEAATQGRADSQGVIDVVTEERGVVVLSQTCDLVRDSINRPFVEIAPLVELEADDYQEALRGRSLRFAVVPGLATQRLVADLDRVMTIEKPLLASVADQRVEGCASDADRRVFATALSRRRGRFAFPDDFATAMKKVVEHVLAKHSKDSPLGEFLRRLFDIRAECPDWETAAPDVVVLFVFPSIRDVPADASKHAEALIARFVVTGTFDKPRAQVVALDTMTAARYVGTDALDLDHLSIVRTI